MRKSALALAVVSSSFAFAYADTYDKRLEYVETTGTQWIDTGIHFNYRRSVFRAVFRILERPTSFSTICGATDVADSNIGYSSGKYLATTLNVTKRTNGNYVILPSSTGGDSDGYLWPVTGSYDVDKSIEAESDVAVAYCNGRACGKDQKTGVGYNDSGKPDQAMSASFYIGAVNNAGTGLLNHEGTLPKMHWYGLKIWTDGVLVGDFFPAMKNGVAGFFDAVTETFFPSQGADAFVAPEEVVWTGAGLAGDFSDGGNWEGGAAPADLHKVAVFPAATTIEAADTDCAGFFNNLGAIRLAGSDTKLHFTNILNSVHFYAPVGGEGTLCIQSLQNVAKSFSIYSASPNFRGTFMLTNAHVTVCASYALGAKEESEAVYDSSSSFGNMRLQLSDLHRCHAKIHLRRSGQFVFTNNGVWTDVEWIFDGASDLTYHGNGNQTFTFSGPIFAEGTLQKNINYNAGNYAFVGDAKYFGLRKVSFANGSFDRFSAPISSSFLLLGRPEILFAHALERLLHGVERMVPRADGAAPRLDHEHGDIRALRRQRIGQQLVAQHGGLPRRRAVLAHGGGQPARRGLASVTDVADAEAAAKALHAHRRAVVGNDLQRHARILQRLHPRAQRTVRLALAFGRKRVVEVGEQERDLTLAQKRRRQRRIIGENVVRNQ